MFLDQIGATIGVEVRKSTRRSKIFVSACRRFSSGGLTLGGDRAG